MNEKILKFVNESEELLKSQFDKIDKIALFNQYKVLNAFRDLKISERHFSGTTGYGYDDVGRDTLAQMFARVFGGENAIVSPLITCGSHTIAISLFGLLRPNDLLLSIAGKPYDTLDDTIFGVEGEDNGSLKDFGVKYEQIELKNNALDIDEIKKQVAQKKPKVVFIQRSRGYNWRNPISINEIENVCKIIKEISENSFVFVDNCYGEFVEEKEPCEVGADVSVGSLIKNPCGGLAPTGGYIVGTNKAVKLISQRFTSPSLSTEVGSFEMGYRTFYQGLFIAPHVVASAIKGAFLLGSVMNRLGYDILPKNNEQAYDIIKSIKFDTKEELIKFVCLAQKVAPIDSFVTPFPWDMPGYAHQVIMAAGTFVSGASIELSCDSPIKSPYIAYFQGGLTYEHVKIATIEIAEEFAKGKI